MKKIWLIVLAVAVFIVAIGIVGYNLLPKGKVGALETIIPEYAISYWYSYNLSQKIKDFKSHDLFKEIVSLPFYINNVGPKIEETKKRMPFDLDELLKQDTALAMFSFGDFKVGNAKTSQADFGDYLFISRSNKGVKEIKKIIGNPLLRFTQDKNNKFTRYKGFMIVTLNYPERNMALNTCFLSDVIVISNNIDLIEKSIDLFREKTHLGSLANNQKFNEISKKIKKDSLLWGYTDYQLYIKAFKEAISMPKEHTPGYASFMAPDLFANTMGVFDRFAFYIDYDNFKTGLIFKSYAAFNKDNDKYGLASLIAAKGEFDNNAFKLVPGNTIGLVGWNQDFSGLWEFLKKILSGFEDAAKEQLKTSPQAAAYQAKIDDFSIKSTINKVDSFLGVSFEKDLIPLLGNNCGVVFTGFRNCYLELNVPQPFVMPELYCFIELKNISEMSKAMTQICHRIVNQANEFIGNQEKAAKKKEAASMSDAPATEKQPPEEIKYLNFVTSDYKGIGISSIEFKDVPLKALKPNYFILDKYMVFSLSQESAEKIVDLFIDKGQNFTANSSFDAAKKNLPKAYSSLTYLNVAELIDNIGSIELFNNLSKNLASTKRPNAPSAEDLRSIINLLHRIKSCSAAKESGGSDTVINTGYIKIDGLN